MTDVPDARDLEHLAVDLAHQAGTLALSRRETGLTVATKSSPTDVVTDADRAVERFLIDAIRALRPHDLIFGEEGGAEGGAGSAARVRWVLDPIDGTVNYLLGLGHWAVSVAAELDGVVVAGCVHNPVSGHTFHAARGLGARLGEAALHGPREVALTEAVVATGFAYDASMRARQGAVVASVLGQIGNLRRFGSAALDLCAVAAGWVDAYYEATLHEWDYAAGALIAAEAGAVVTGLRGQGPGPGMVVAAHPARVAEFVSLIERAGG